MFCFMCMLVLRDNKCPGAHYEYGICDVRWFAGLQDDFPHVSCWHRKFCSYKVLAIDMLEQQDCCKISVQGTCMELVLFPASVRLVYEAHENRSIGHVVYMKNRSSSFDR